MNITVSYIEKNIFGDIKIITDDILNATDYNLINIFSYFIRIKDKYNSIFVNHLEYLNSGITYTKYLEFAIKYTNIKINNVTIFYSSVQNFVDSILTIKAPSENGIYKIKEMKFERYMDIVTGQIYRMKRREDIEYNLDNLVFI